MTKSTIMVSGYFDPLHYGHINLITFASGYGKVIVALNSDRACYIKKGYVFMPYKDRELIIASLRKVYQVIQVIDEDETVCKTLELVNPTYFANGGDRISPHPREDEVCKRLNIKQLFKIGGAKVESSQSLTKRVAILLEGHSSLDYL